MDIADTPCLGYRTSQSYEEWERTLSTDRKAEVVTAIGLWSFSAHEFSDDELVYGALRILQHAMTVDDLNRWAQPARMYDQIIYVDKLTIARRDFCLLTGLSGFLQQFRPLSQLPPRSGRPAGAILLSCPPRCFASISGTFHSYDK